MNKGKISKKLADIRSRHKSSLQLDSSSIITQESGWCVSSATKNEMYNIAEVNLDCKCQLVCGDCETCMHRYSCSCIDSSVKWNMCKHVHLLCRWRDERGRNISTSQVDQTIQEDPNEDCDNLHIAISCFEEESSIIKQEISKEMRTDVEDFNKRKRKLIGYLSEKIDGISSPSKLHIVERVIAPISPLLAAAGNLRQLPSPKKAAHNQNISVQRRLFSTKKWQKSATKVSQNLDSQTDSNVIAMSLLDSL